MSNQLDREWVHRLPAFAEGLRAGKLVVCAGCQHYRSAPELSAQGKCLKDKTECYAFVPFECAAFRSILAADDHELWLAAAIGGEEAVEKVKETDARELRGEYLRGLVIARQSGQTVVGGQKKRTLNECLTVLYG